MRRRKSLVLLRLIGMVSGDKTKNPPNLQYHSIALDEDKLLLTREFNLPGDLVMGFQVHWPPTEENEQQQLRR